MKQKRIHINNKGSIRGKLLIGFAIPILMIVVLGVVSVNMSSKAIMNQYRDSSSAMINSVGQYLELITGQTESMAMQYSTDSNVMTYFGNSRLDVDSRQKLSEDLLVIIKSNCNASASINSITFIGKDDFPISTTQTTGQKKLFTTNAYNEFVASDLYEEYLASGQSMYWVGYNPYFDERVTDSKDKYILSLVRKLSGDKSVVVIDVNKSLITEALLSMNTEEGYISGFITSDNKEIIVTELAKDYEDKDSGAKKKAINTEISMIDQDFINKIYESEDSNGIMDITYDGESYMLMYYKVGNTNSYIYQLVPEHIIISKAQSIKSLTMVIVCIAIILAIIVAAVISKNINGSIKKVIRPIVQASDGDLTVDIDTSRRDEFGVINTNLDNMLSGMKMLISHANTLSGQVNDSVENVNDNGAKVLTGCDDICRAIDEIEKGVYQQAEDAEACLYQMDALSDKIKMLFDNANAIEGIASDTKEAVAKGKYMMSDLSEKTEQTTEITSDVIGGITKLEIQSRSISSIVDTINGIADQTNLLALNASIEAARAGVSGRGFVVVAEEIRKLSEQSQEAANQILDIITDIQEETNMTVEVAARAEDIVNVQQESLANTVELFETINYKVSGLVNNLQTIVDGIDSIETAKNDSLDAIRSISSVAEETAAASQEVKTASIGQFDAVEELNQEIEGLGNHANSLVEAISKFIVD